MRKLSHKILMGALLMGGVVSSRAFAADDQICRRITLKLVHSEGEKSLASLPSNMSSAEMQNLRDQQGLKFVPAPEQNKVEVAAKVPEIPAYPKLMSGKGDVEAFIFDPKTSPDIIAKIDRDPLIALFTSMPEVAPSTDRYIFGEHANAKIDENPEASGVVAKILGAKNSRTIESKRRLDFNPAVDTVKLVLGEHDREVSFVRVFEYKDDGAKIEEQNGISYQVNYERNGDNITAHLSMISKTADVIPLGTFTMNVSTAISGQKLRLENLKSESNKNAPVEFQKSDFWDPVAVSYSFGGNFMSFLKADALRVVSETVANFAKKKAA